MACEPVNPLGHWSRLVAVLAVLVALTGCGKQQQIAHYRVPKEPEIAEPSGGGATEAATTAGAKTDRMLAAAIPHGDAAWFFKLAGPAEAVGKCADDFESLIKSVTFANNAGGKPEWKLPEGWKQTAGASGMRFATVSIPAEPKALELTVVSLPWSAEDETKQMVANVNRWRGQMQLPDIVAADLAKETHSVKLAAGEATLVDLEGSLKPTGMQPPFAGGGAGKRSLPADHPPIAPAEKKAAASPRSDSAKQAPPGDVAPDQSKLPFTFTAPSAWRPSSPNQFAIAAFAAKEGDGRADITVSPLFGPGGNVLANVNRWRGQLGLEPVAENELDSCVQPYKVDGKPAQMVRLQAPEDADQRRAITAVLVKQDDTTWFFTMKADAAQAVREQPNFEKFIGSVKFRGEK